MIIDKKLSIITYAGSSPLNLMTKDPDIANDPIKSNDWDKLIQSVDTIYGTQSNDDSIPVFWTRRFASVDQFGNTSYKYAPHPESTLKQLDSTNAYYFIIRDSSSIPIQIPAQGEALAFGVVSVENAPYLSPSLDDAILTKESFEYSFKPQIVDLTPYQTYTYEWKVLSSNWPVATNAISGTLKPASSTGTINSTMTFCPNTEECSQYILPYVLPSSCSLEQIRDPYITLQLSIKTNNTNLESLSDPFTITCDDCLPKPRINISTIGENIVQEPLDDDSPTPSYSFNLTFSNLEINKSYIYNIEPIKVDWPIVFVTPMSGTFTNIGGAVSPINNKFYFCPTTGLCPPNGSTVPNYSIPNYPKFLTSESEYQIFLRASLSGASQEVCSLSGAIYSDIARITYKKS